MTVDVILERVEMLDPALLADCDFRIDSSERSYPFDRAFAVPRSPDQRILAVARLGGRVAGYLACQRDGDVAEVRRIEVDRACRGAGIGRLLLEEARRWARHQALSALVLVTLADNPAAGRFFARHGFVRLETGKVSRWHLPLCP